MPGVVVSRSDGTCTDAKVFFQPTDGQTFSVLLAETGIGLDADNGTDGQMLVPTGVASAPGIAWAIDPTTGIYSDAAGHIKFATGGVARFHISNSGIISYFNSFIIPAVGVFAFSGSTKVTTGGVNGNLLLTNNNTSQGVKFDTATLNATLILTDEVGGDLNVGAAYFTTTTSTYAATTLSIPVGQQLTFPGGGAASQTATGLISAGCILQGVTSRVVTTGTTCTSADIGIAGDLDAFANNTNITDNQTSDITDSASGVASGAFSAYPTAVDVVVTAVGGNCVDLVIDVYSHCTTISAPTLDL